MAPLQDLKINGDGGNIGNPEKSRGTHDNFKHTLSKTWNSGVALSDGEHKTVI